MKVFKGKKNKAQTATSTDGSVPEAQVSKKFSARSHLKSPKKLAVICVALILVGLIGWTGYHYFVGKKNKGEDKPVTTTVCGETAEDGVLSESITQLKTGQTRNLQPLVDKIKALPGYEQDPNCLYILSTYYLGSGDVVSAEKYLNPLTTTYSEVKPNTTLMNLGGDVASLKGRYETIQSQVKSYQGSFSGTGTPKEQGSQ